MARKGIIATLIESLFKSFVRARAERYTAPPLPDMSESERIVNISSNPPDGFSTELFTDVAVSGVSYRKAAVQAFIDGCERRIKLVREPSNEADENAIKVMGIFKPLPGGEDITKKLGYVEAGTADDIAEEHSKAKLGGSLETIYRATRDKNAGLRITIWTK